MQVAFTVHGKITSANRVTRRVGNLSLKSASARIDTARIASLATAARAVANWTMPPRAWLAIVAYNSRLDAGNVEKVIGDGIKGILIADDSPRYLAMLTVEHRRDTRGERYEVTVRPLPAAE